ncbi:hypothetical protein niasHT_015589 [Heterodera trifolii]|uniref:Uncharacterized protein n=1 Tax=Heterodera trifolii TaxID=157864 RepID=A0ABD2LCC4_9BILA
MYIPSPRFSGPTTQSHNQLHCQTDVLSGASSGGSSTLLVESTAHSQQHQKSNGSNSANEQQHLRKFTSAVGKLGKARETREAISKVLSCANPLRSAPIAEPIDYEHFVGEHSAQLEHDKDRDMLLFLRDDISGVEIWPRERTAVPSVRHCDIDEANWLLAMDSLRHYSSPYHIYNKYFRFDPPLGLNFLRFESDLIADEEKLLLSGQSASFATQPDILKEGNLIVVPGDGIVDTFRSEKKRYCVLRKSAEESRVFIEVYKHALAQPQHQQQMPTMEMEVKAAAIKSTKKGKLLQLFSSTESDKRALLLSAESETELQFWLFSIERALAWNNREMMLAPEEDNLSLNSSGRDNSIPPCLSSLNDSESLASEDSGGSREFSTAFWRSRNAAAKALQPPIVERRNIFSLFWDMEPLPEGEGEKSTLGEQLSETEQCNVERISPIPSSSATTTNLVLRPNFGGKRTTSHEPSSFDEETKGQLAVREDSQCLEPSKSEFAGEKPAILFTAQLRQLDIRIRMAGKEHAEQIEPFFARLFLFDASLGVRVSEEFHVDFPSLHYDMLQQNGHANLVKFANSAPPSSFALNGAFATEKVNGISWEQIRNANKLICSIHNPRADLFLVVLVERILSDVSADIYMKANNATDNKYSSKIQKSLSASIPKLGHLRTLFAWTARPVFPSLCSGSVFASQQLAMGSTNNCGSLSDGSKKSSLATCSLYKCDSGRLTDGDLQKLLIEMQKADKLAKLMVFPSAALVLETDVTSVLCEFPMRISPSFLPLRPWKCVPTSPDKPSALPSFELQSFLDQSLCSEPHRGRINLLYVYPLSLNYSTQKTFSRARNISCTVRYVPSSLVRTTQFAHGRVPSHANIFHRTHPNGPFVDSFVCGVQYHEQSPQFNAEVKMDLPVALGEDDHILFTFHHISISNAITNKNKPFTEHNIETPVGYAWLPMVKTDSRGLPHFVMSDKSQEFELPVTANLSSKYYEFKPLSSSGTREMSPNFDLKFVEYGRPLFRVRLRLVSSVFTTDERLQNFFQLCHLIYPNITQSNRNPLTQVPNSSSSRNFKHSSNMNFYANNASKNGCSASDIQDDSLSPPHFAIEHDLVESIEKLSSIDLDQLIPFLAVIFDRLFNLLTLSKAEDVMLSSLNAIICLADQLFMHRKSKRELLRNYVLLFFKCQGPQFKCDADGEESTHGAICKCIPLMIHRAQTSKDGTISITKLLRQLWFLLDCAAKSMAHWLIIHNLLKVPRRNRFPTDLYFSLEELFHTITERIIFMQRECPRESRMANNALGNFLKHCLSLMDRYQIMKELYTVVKKMDTIETRSFRIYKFELLQILAGHEHWLPLCLPLLTDKFGIILRGDSFRVEGSSSTQTQQQTTKHNGGTSLLVKLFSQIFSPFHGIISESNEVEKFSSYSEHFYLSKTYCSVHFPIGLLLQELSTSLRDSRDYRRKVIQLLRNLLAKHSQDERYGDTSARNRIAILTMPLLRIAIENIKEIELATTSLTEDACQNRLSALTNATHELVHCGNMESNGYVSANSTINANTTSKSNNGNNNNALRTNSIGPNGSTVTVVLAERMDKNEVRDLMLCVLYTLNILPKKILAAFWNVQEAIQPNKTVPSCDDSVTELPKQPQQNVLVDFVRILELSLLLFRYRGRTHHLMLQAKRNKATNPNKTPEFLLKSDGSNSYGMSSKFSTLNEINFGESFDSRGVADEEGKGGEATSFLMDCNLAQEVALIVLETVQTIANQIAAKTRYTSTSSLDVIFVRLLHLQLELLNDCWPETVRLHTLSALAVFVNLFSAHFLNSGPLDCLSTLIKALLLQLNSRIVRIQNATAALLHLILRSGYDLALNSSVSKFPSDFSSMSAPDGSKNSSLTERLGRPGAQIAPVLARLLSEKAVFLNSFRFDRGLSALESLIGCGSATKSGAGAKSVPSSALVLTSLFDKAVLELVKQLRGVLEATQAISDTINDPIQLADLHIQLANSFRGSAALRAEFFDALAAQHIAGAWYSEAAVCQAHSLVIIGKELQSRGLIRPDWTLLSVLSERITATEGNNESGLMSSTQQGGFTLEEFTRKVEALVRVLLLSERYEAVGPICRLAIPIFEQNNDFKALVGIYAEIQQACSRAAEIKISGKRHLGTYFKVTFYGNSHFGTEHLTEWIYREPKLTSLAEACDRMVQTVRNSLGHDRVKVISGRSEANDPTTAYVKVAHVEPCRRPTELNNNNNAIMPTKGGREKQQRVASMTNCRERERPMDELKEDNDPMRYNLHTNISTFIQEERLVDHEVPENAPELARTALRRLTLTVGNSFPDTRRRQRIVKTEEAVLNPLELACECLLFKTAQIRHILSAAEIPRGFHCHIGATVDKNALKRLDLKKLQLFLQGSVSPSVNAGLLAYAETFTASAQRHRYGKDGICRLATALKTLIYELNEALAVNEAAMGSERTEYQQMLRRSFDGMLERLPTFFDGEKFLPDMTSQDGRAALGGANSQLVNGVLDRLSQIGGMAAEMHIFDSISGLSA